MANTKDIIDGIIDKLDKIDKKLDGVVDLIDEVSPAIEDVSKMGHDKAQAFVDSEMEKLNTRVADELNKIRESIVDTLSSQVKVVKEKVEEYIAPISAFVTIDWTNGTITPNISADLSQLKDFAEAIIKMWVPEPAVKFAIDFPTKVFPKVESVSDKIQEIASYQLEVPDVEDIDIPSLDIDVEPITLGDIMNS